LYISIELAQKGKATYGDNRREYFEDILDVAHGRQVGDFFQPARLAKMGVS
jgi:hypothetical protein